MALQRDTHYPGRYSTGDAAHPQGAFKNRTTPTSQDGSYLEQDWLNDWDGFFASLLTEVGMTPDGSIDKVGASQYFNALKGVVTQPGALMYYAASSAPSGWLKANGAAVSRTTYATLFAAIGTTFGAGDGSTTFNLPDLRGEFIRGYDDGRGIDSGRAIGSSQAAYAGALTIDVLTYKVNSGSAAVITDAITVNGTGIGGDMNESKTIEVTANDNRPRNVALLACIKY